MEKYISVNNNSYPVDYPDKCPICHHYGDIAFVHSFQTKEGVQIIYQCPFIDCRSYFIGYYGLPTQNSLLQLLPAKPDITSFPACISQISPIFLAIFEEAETARQLGLTQIAGPGLRKAFEFLIKDYAKILSPDKSAEIESKYSGNVVKKFIDDKRIQSVAERTLWLGNDETHYLRKWEMHDLVDLLNLIRVTVNWIDTERTSQKYIIEMPDKSNLEKN
ncbi:MAG: hypothetical protein ACYC49_11105 [Ignavibacteriaceae bacterium]